MTSSDRSSSSDDLFSSLLESLSAPDDRAAAEQSYFRPAVDTAPDPTVATESLGEIDEALFPSMVIDLSDSPQRAAVPTDVGQLTREAGAGAGTWGPDAGVPAVVDPLAMSQLFPDDDGGTRAPPLVPGSFEPHVPWWENRRIQAAIGIGAAAVLIAGGLFVALRGGSNDRDDDLSTGPLPEAPTRNEDAAVTTSVPEGTPTPTGLPAPPTDLDGGTTGSTVKSSTPTTKKPATTIPPGKPPSGGSTATTAAPTTTPTTDAGGNTPDTTPTTNPPVEADVQYGRDMAARTSIFPGWQGVWAIGDGNVRNAFFTATFNEPARILTINIDVEGASEYNLRFDVSVVPGTSTTTPNTNYGSITATLDGARNLTIDNGTKIPGTSANNARITGPLTTSKVRLDVQGDADGFDPFSGVYAFE